MQVPVRREAAGRHSRTRRLTPVLVGLAVLAAVALSAILFATLRGGTSNQQAGCVTITAASSTGGATFSVCGKSATELCRAQASRHDAYARTVQASCRRAGYP